MNENTIITTCCSCGIETECELTVDPFIEEVFGTYQDEQWWCKGCLRERADDI